MSRVAGMSWDVKNSKIGKEEEIGRKRKKKRLERYITRYPATVNPRYNDRFFSRGLFRWREGA